MSEFMSHINTCLPLDSLPSMKDHSRHLEYDEMAEATPTLKSLIGRCFKTRTSYAIFTNFGVIQKLTSVDVSVYIRSVVVGRYNRHLVWKVFPHHRCEVEWLSRLDEGVCVGWLW